MSNKKIPYRNCDYNCKDCDNKEDCIVNLMLIDQSLQNLFSAENTCSEEVILNGLGQDLRKINSFLQNSLDKQDPRFLEKNGDEPFDSFDHFEDEYIKEHPVYKQVLQFYDNSKQFLAAVLQNPSFGNSFFPSLEKIDWHVTLLLTKIYRLLSSSLFLEKNLLDEFIYEEVAQTLELIKKSISIVRTSLEKIKVLSSEETNTLDSLNEELYAIEDDINDLELE
ncbi:hypothetical protein ACFL1T_00620 [Chlamydiota bacterium]